MKLRFTIFLLLLFLDWINSTCIGSAAAVPPCWTPLCSFRHGSAVLQTPGLNSSGIPMWNSIYRLYNGWIMPCLFPASQHWCRAMLDWHIVGPPWPEELQLQHKKGVPWLAEVLASSSTGTVWILGYLASTKHLLGQWRTRRRTLTLPFSLFYVLYVNGLDRKQILLCLEHYLHCHKETLTSVNSMVLEWI